VTELPAARARWVRVNFGSPTSGSSGGRLVGVRVEEVQRSIARLEQQVSGEPAAELGTEQSATTGTAEYKSDVSPGGQSAALVLSIVNGTTGREKLAAEYNMSDALS